MAYKNKRGKITESIPTYLPIEIKKQFKAKCEAEERTPSEVLRRFIYAYLAGLIS